MSRAKTALAAMAVVQACACAVPKRPAELPSQQRAWIAVLSGEMPDAIEDVARHAWIVGSLPGDGSVHRWELLGSAFRSETNRPFDYFGNGDVAVHGVVEGDVVEIHRIMKCLDREVHAYNDRHPDYFPIPGPNSNTFVAEALRECGIHVELPATAIGRDYRGIVGAGVTESGTGLQLESWVAGVRVGLREGAEAHLAGLALGVHAWPPGVTVPVNPGRIGLDFDGHLQKGRGSFSEGPGSFSEGPGRRFGVGVAQMVVEVARVKRPEDAGGLAERATVGLSARGVLAKRHLGYGFGADLDLGLGFPAAFAYRIHLYPAGIAWTFGPTGYVGVFGGVGASGVGGQVTGGFEVPLEMRAEIDAGPSARLGLRAATIWVPGVDDRRGRSMLPFGDELVLGTFARFGSTKHGSFGTMGRGHFFGLERHEVMHTYWLGVTFGVEVDYGG
jgi:hypothetical protein